MKKNTDSLTGLIIEGIQEKKGKGIVVIDLEGIESCGAMKFIVCQGNSTSQVVAIADSIREYVLKNGGVKPFNYDGYKNAQWIVLDYGEVLVHVFLPDVRTYYNIEELWSDATLVTIPDLD